MAVGIWKGEKWGLWMKCASAWRKKVNKNNTLSFSNLSLPFLKEFSAILNFWMTSTTKESPGMILDIAPPPNLTLNENINIICTQCWDEFATFLSTFSLKKIQTHGKMYIHVHEFNFYRIFCNYHPVELTKQQWILAVERNLLMLTHFDPMIELTK